MNLVSVSQTVPALVRVEADLGSLAELNMLTGIAAILTYPLDIEVVEEEEREEKERLEKEKREPSEAREQEA